MGIPAPSGTWTQAGTETGPKTELWDRGERVMNA